MPIWQIHARITYEEIIVYKSLLGETRKGLWGFKKKNIKILTTYSTCQLVTHRGHPRESSQLVIQLWKFKELQTK